MGELENPKKIIMYASVGNNVPPHLIGGGETGTKRTIKILNEDGYDVCLIDKAIMGLGIFHYIKMLIKAIYKFNLSIKKEKDIIVYVVGYYERNVLIEWLLLSLAKNRGKKTIYEARNGRLVKAYYENSFLYKKIMISILNKADAVFCQGQEYISFIQDKVGKNGIYTPNYVFDSNIKPYCQRDFKNGINLVYSGRLVPSKNIDMIIRIASMLKQKKEIVKLYLIGSADKDYYKEILEIIEFENLNSEVILTGYIKLNEINEILQKCHFFIFPSREIKEGHSNALTEAMSFGVVPIVSMVGFNKSIVNEKELIIDDYDEAIYAEKIMQIKNNNWNELSIKMYERVHENYTESIIRKRIIETLNSLNK